jgi:hypothetical protein
METHYRLSTCGRTFAVLVLSWLIVSPCLPGQASKDEPVVIIGISRNTGPMDAMESTPEILPNGRVVTGIAAYLSPDGQLIDPLCTRTGQTNCCNSDDGPRCKLLESLFITHARTYWGISGEPHLRVTSIPRTIDSDDCFGTGTLARISGSTATSAVVTTKPALFSPVQPMLPVSNLERTEIQARAEQLIRNESEDLLIPSIYRIEKFRLTKNGYIYLVAEGRKQDTKNKENYGKYCMFFGIWRISGDTYTLVDSNGDMHYQEPEYFIGTIHIKGEKSDFIVTSDSNSEGNEFYIYGLRNGVLQRIYDGGGGGC